MRLCSSPQIGADLSESYWKPGNSEMFLDLVEKLTGKPLSADAWVEELNKSIAAKVEEEQKEYEEVRGQWSGGV